MRNFGKLGDRITFEKPQHRAERALLFDLLGKSDDTPEDAAWNRYAIEHEIPHIGTEKIKDIEFMWRQGFQAGLNYRIKAY